jgi:polysaccharide deacetylase 2 family uncharacterized protein YibQ
MVLNCMYPPQNSTEISLLFRSSPVNQPCSPFSFSRGNAAEKARRHGLGVLLGVPMTAISVIWVEVKSSINEYAR